MKTIKSISPVLTLLVSLSLILVMGCEPELELEDQQTSKSIDERALTPIESSALPEEFNAVSNSNNPFPVLHQGFNHDTYPWADQSNPGPTGWCGTVEHHDKKSGPVDPSKGKGYATVEQGPCNDFWTNVGIPSNAPANTLDFDIFSTSWPSSGFVQKLDIYLDPDDYSNGLAFTFINSLNALNSTVIPFDFLYFHIDVNKVNGNLDVAGYEVENEGWYTFRYVFNSDASGMLTVEFQLVENGQPLHTKSIDNTFFELVTSDYSVDELGSGYIWFAQIADGVTLPIDEQHLHPANNSQ